MENTVYTPFEYNFNSRNVFEVVETSNQSIAIRNPAVLTPMEKHDAIGLAAWIVRNSGLTLNEFNTECESIWGKDSDNNG